LRGKVFVPSTFGANCDLPDERAPLRAVREHVNVYTNFDAFLGSAPNLRRYAGWVITRTGSALMGGEDRVHGARDRPHAELV